MPAFDAAAVVEELKVRLKPYVEFEEVIREPSDQMIAEFMRDIQKIVGELQKITQGARDLDEDDPVAALAALQELDPEVYVKTMADMAESYSRLCSGRPSTEQLLKLPLRARYALYSYLQRKVVSPEAESAAGATVVSLQQRAANG